MLAFDDNYISNKGTPESGHETNQKDDSDGDDGFFLQEQRTRTLTRVPQLSVEERRRRITQLKQSTAAGSRGAAAGPRSNEKVTQTPQISRRAILQ